MHMRLSNHLQTFRFPILTSLASLFSSVFLKTRPGLHQDSGPLLQWSDMTQFALGKNVIALVSNC